MYRVIGILLATTCIDSKESIPYPVYIPIDYRPQGYDYMYLPAQFQYNDQTLYSNSISHTDENFQPDTSVSDKEIVLNEVPSSTPNRQEFKTSSQTPEVATPTKLLQKDEVVYEFKTNELSSGASFIEGLKVPLNKAPEQAEEESKSEESNKYLTNDLSQSQNNYKEQIKYSSYIKYSPNNPADGKYSPNNPPDNKYLSKNLQQSQKIFKEQLKYSNDNNYSLKKLPGNKYPTNNVPSSQINYKEQVKYANINNYLPNNPYNNKFSSNNVLKSQNDYIKLVKYLNDNNYLPNINEYLTSIIPLSQNNYKEQVKYSNDYNYLPINPPNNKFSSKNVLTSQNNYKEQVKYSNKNNNYLPNNLSDNKYSSNNVLTSQNSYIEQVKYPNNNKNSPNNPHDEYPTKNSQSSPNDYIDKLKYIKINHYPSKNDYHSRLNYQYENKYPYYISVPSKDYQERPRYEDIHRYPSIPDYPSQIANEKKPNKTTSEAIYSQKLKEQPNNYPKQDEYSNSESSSESSSEEDPTPDTINESPSESEQETSTKEYKNQKNSSYAVAPLPPKYLGPQGTDKVSSIEWYAPPFYQSLKEIEATENIIMSRIFGKNPMQNEKQYTIIMGVLDGMVKTMSITPWQNYDREYDSKVPQLLKYVRATRHIANSQLKCVYDWINLSINKIRTIMSNTWIRHICSISDVPCDTLVLTVVDASKDVQLQKEAHLLLSLGKAARLFLNRYVKTLDRLANVDRPSDLYSFVLDSKNYFRPLIEASSEAHSLLPSFTYNCYDGPKKFTPGVE